MLLMKYNAVLIGAHYVRDHTNNLDKTRQRTCTSFSRLHIHYLLYLGRIHSLEIKSMYIW